MEILPKKKCPLLFLNTISRFGWRFCCEANKNVLYSFSAPFPDLDEDCCEAKQGPALSQHHFQIWIEISVKQNNALLYHFQIWMEIALLHGYGDGLDSHLKRVI
jgi:hypothetical protein